MQRANWRALAATATGLRPLFRSLVVTTDVSFEPFADMGCGALFGAESSRRRRAEHGRPAARLFCIRALTSEGR